MITEVGSHPQAERNKNDERVRQMVRSERRLTVRMVADKQGMNSERVWRIITEDLCKNGTQGS